MTKQEAMKLAAIEFTQGIPIQEVMSKYNVSYASVYNAIKKYDIPYKKTYGRTVFFDEDFFNIIDTGEKAYWLGFIMADGNVNKTSNKYPNYNRLTIGISIDDNTHLDKFKSIINHTGNYVYESHKESYSTKPICYLYCNSIKMVSNLIALGVTPRKTGYSNIPNIPQELIHHFLRGYFDGDGCISVYHDKKNVLRGEFSITTDSNILYQIQDILITECSLNKTKLKSYKHTEYASSLRYGGIEQLKRIQQYLYKDATVYLQRKYDKFSLLLSQ